MCKLLFDGLCSQRSCATLSLPDSEANHVHALGVVYIAEDGGQEHAMRSIELPPIDVEILLQLHSVWTIVSVHNCALSSNCGSKY